MKKSLLSIFGILIFCSILAQSDHFDPKPRSEKVSIESVSPNPVEANFTVHLEDRISFENIEIKIFNIIGVQLRSIEVKNNAHLRINIEEFASGPYIVSVHKEGKLQDSSRIIKK